MLVYYPYPLLLSTEVYFMSERLIQVKQVLQLNMSTDKLSNLKKVSTAASVMYYLAGFTSDFSHFPDFVLSLVK